LSTLLWLALRLGPSRTRIALPPLVLSFLLTSPDARAASRGYLTRALGRPARLADIARHFATFGAAVLERVYLMAGHDAGFDITVEGLDSLQRQLEAGQGCVLLGSHLGSFEALRAVARAAPAPVRPMMYRRNAGALTDLLDRLAPALRDSVIEIGEPGSMLRAKEALERGEMVGLLADRSPRGERLVTVPFLGTPAAFPAGPFVLAAALGVPVFLFYGLRLGLRRYRVRFVPFADRLELRRASREDDLRQWIVRYAAALEGNCREHPFNWFNFFPFWEADRHVDADPPPAGDHGDDRGDRRPAADCGHRATAAGGGGAQHAADGTVRP
jgi:predicted LPLAT superfamily acyltransferase